MNRLLPVVIEPKIDLRFHTHYPLFCREKMSALLILAAAVSDMSDDEFGHLVRKFKTLKEEGVI